ncbi:(Fe-S)-binding protein [Kineobactrum sediminis]|nr:(Fe-S)-binding protein [Kineobactrum sediminis]
MDHEPMHQAPPKRKRKRMPPSREVALMVTCLADLMRPSVGFASLRLLQRAGCAVVVPEQQTCCGQPAYNSGDLEATVPVAKAVIAAFEPYDYVVVPSGSCAGMLCRHYPSLLEGEWRERALALAAKTWELTRFLTEVAPLPRSSKRPPLSRTVTYHDGCAGLRELGIREQPRKLLADHCGVTVSELSQSEVCCGFGGTFCAKMPDISGKMVDDKLDHAIATGADMLVGGDLGCLLNIAGRATRRDLTLEVRHIAELLVGETTGPGIGEPQQ